MQTLVVLTFMTYQCIARFDVGHLVIECVHLKVMLTRWCCTKPSVDFQFESSLCSLTFQTFGRGICTFANLGLTFMTYQCIAPFDVGHLVIKCVHLKVMLMRWCCTKPSVDFEFESSLSSLTFETFGRRICTFANLGCLNIYDISMYRSF